MRVFPCLTGAAAMALQSRPSLWGISGEFGVVTGFMPDLGLVARVFLPQGRRSTCVTSTIEQDPFIEANDLWH